VRQEGFSSPRLSEVSSRSVLYWLQAFSCRHYRVSTSAGVVLRTGLPDRDSFTCAPRICPGYELPESASISRLDYRAPPLVPRRLS
jgi:hypothetical protein